MPDEMLSAGAIGQALLLCPPAGGLEGEQFAFERIEHVLTNTEVHRRERPAVDRHRPRRARLGIPVNDVRPRRFAGHPVPDLLIEPNRAAVWQRVEHVPAIQADVAAAGRAVDARLGMIRTREGPAVAVREPVVVLGPGPERAGEGLSVDEDLLIAFTPPDEHVVGQFVHRADHLSLSRCVQQIRIERQPSLAAERSPLGAKMIAAVRERVRSNVQIDLDGVRDRAGVGQTQTHRLAERHQQPAGHPSAFIDGEEQVLVRIHAGTGAE